MARSGPEIGPLPKNPSEFQRKLHAWILKKQPVAAIASHLGVSEACVRQWARRPKRVAPLDKVQKLAESTATPACYWADNGWRVKDEPCDAAATCPRLVGKGRVHAEPHEYAAGETDDGRVGEGRGASFAAEPGARTPSADEARFLAAQIVRAVYQGIADGMAPSDVEREIAAVIERECSELLRKQA